MEQILDTLANFLIDYEIVDKQNTKLRDSVLADDFEQYKLLISKGYNPFKIIDEKRSYQYSTDPKYFQYAHNWVYALAVNMNPHNVNNVKRSQ